MVSGSDYPERAELVLIAHLAHQRYLARRARIAADATRSRSAPIEARLKAEQAKKERGSLGAILAQAMTNAHQRDKKR
ncbi:MAG: hypothetical protein WA173_15680 [Pseudomonas sp.]|uniref:hypothetical protein n=1 Tax=Pseudomonas sp. TaxID=306 RepID=UPI003BB4EE76